MKARDNIIKLDIDSKELYGEYLAYVLSSLDTPPVKGIKVMETKKGYHVYITLKRYLYLKDIIILQLLLGSDMARERFNYMRLLNGRWENVLFAAKRRLDGSYSSSEELTPMAIKIAKEFIDEYTYLTEGD